MCRRNLARVPPLVGRGNQPDDGSKALKKELGIEVDTVSSGTERKRVASRAQNVTAAHHFSPADCNVVEQANGRDEPVDVVDRRV